MARNLTVAVLMAGSILGSLTLNPAHAQAGMGSMTTTTKNVIPRVKGFSEGKEILFLHTETSDPKTAQMLTSMISSPVLVVPSLAKVPKEALANLYVFTNGVKGTGPLGFQPDIFDRPAGRPGYSPLRTLNQVTWKGNRKARVLKSAKAVQAAASKGDVTIRPTNTVVNMPMVTWPGGKR